MMITKAEQESIREVLWHNLKYRETFDELYDHILSSIEIKEDDKQRPYELARYIVDTEFGGWDGIKKLETAREKSIQRQFRKSLWTEMKSYFSFPLIAFTVLITAGIFSIASNGSRMYISTFLFITVMVPAVTWYFIAPFNRWSKKYKPSIKERSAERLGTFGVSLFNILLLSSGLFSAQPNYKFLLKANTSLLTPVAILLIVYCLSAVKVFRREFKLQIT
jgi:hypothetical protein